MAFISFLQYVDVGWESQGKREIIKAYQVFVTKCSIVTRLLNG